MSSRGIPVKHWRETPGAYILARHLQPDRSGGPDPDDSLASTPQETEMGQRVIARDYAKSHCPLGV